jgi:dienelactone hydrolase
VANDTVPLQVWIPSRREGPFPAVILLHYWGAGDIRSERNTAQELCRRGIAGIVLHLPYHLRRTPPGTRSGELAIVAKPEAMIRTMSQGVLDVRRAVDWIATRPEFDKEKIGIAGTSLGAIVASVSASVEPRLKFAAFVLGGADLAHILWNSSRVVKQRDEMRRDGLTEERLREVLKPIEPLRYLPEAKLQGSFVIGARYDSVIPAQDTQKLIDALDKPKSVWLDTGHYGGFLIQKQVQRAAAAFFASEFSGTAYVPPKRITAPTVRVGAQLNSDNGLEVSLGLDIWRGTARGDRPSVLWSIVL